MRPKLCLAISELLGFLAMILVGAGLYCWGTHWYLNIAAVIAGVLLGALALKLEPGIFVRRPRGGPMEDPDKTLVLDRHDPGSRPDPR